MNGEDKSGRKGSCEQVAPKPPRPVRQPSKQGKEPPPGSNPQQHQDDTMGQLKRTFAGIFGEVQ